MELTGACFCGAIKYRIRGRLYDARSCHCSRCRKAFSAQASAYAQIDRGSLQWLAGEEHLASYVGAHEAGKQFCKICGSMLTGIVQGHVHGIALGCLDEAPPDLRLDTHIFVGSKASWEALPQGITAYEEGPPASPRGD